MMKCEKRTGFHPRKTLWVFSPVLVISIIQYTTRQEGKPTLASQVHFILRPLAVTDCPKKISWYCVKSKTFRYICKERT